MANGNGESPLGAILGAIIGTSAEEGLNQADRDALEDLRSLISTAREGTAKVREVTGASGIPPEALEALDLAFLAVGGLSPAGFGAGKGRAALGLEDLFSSPTPISRGRQAGKEFFRRAPTQTPRSALSDAQEFADVRAGILGKIDARLDLLDSPVLGRRARQELEDVFGSVENAIGIRNLLRTPTGSAALGEATRQRVGVPVAREALKAGDFSILAEGLKGLDDAVIRRIIEGSRGGTPGVTP